MRRTPVAVAVEKGIEHLDATYPNWWKGIKLADLSIYSPTGHVLAQIAGRLSYETNEVMTWSRAKLEAHGFRPESKLLDYAILSEEWIYQIANLKKERKEWMTESPHRSTSF